MTETLSSANFVIMPSASGIDHVGTPLIFWCDHASTPIVRETWIRECMDGAMLGPWAGFAWRPTGSEAALVMSATVRVVEEADNDDPSDFARQVKSLHAMVYLPIHSLQ